MEFLFILMPFSEIEIWIKVSVTCNFCAVTRESLLTKISIPVFLLCSCRYVQCHIHSFVKVNYQLNDF